jgi:adenosylmethionine-8-amino-7-oxononanoate aminotransferase
MSWVENDLKYIWHPCSQMKDYEDFPPIGIEYAKGLYLYGTDSNKYADMISSWWCNLLGHCHPGVNKAVKEQIDKLEHVIFAGFTHEKAVELCERLVKVLPGNSLDTTSPPTHLPLDKFFFTDNGSSAVEAAMKMSFQYNQQCGAPQKKRFMALEGGYHGETLGALSAGALDLYAQKFKPLLLDVIRLRPDDFEQTEEMFARYGDEVCALIVEPILQMAAGMRIYSPEYLAHLRTLCDKYNVHLIADEIATGFGRTGKMFACEHAGIAPDIMCLSKGLTGGYMPMALTVTTTEIYNAFYGKEPFLHSHTYSGSALACAAACEVLKIFEEENILAKAQENAPYFAQLVREKFPHARSIGLINAFEVPNAKEFCRSAIKKGVLLRPLGDVSYLNPPLTIERWEMEEVIDKISKYL